MMELILKYYFVSYAPGRALSEFNRMVTTLTFIAFEGVRTGPISSASEEDVLHSNLRAFSDKYSAINVDEIDLADPAVLHLSE